MTVDYSMLYILAIVIVAIAIACGVKVLKKKNLISESDLQLVTQIFKLSANMIKELNLKNEPEISKISDIVISALQYANTVSASKTKEEMTALATEEAYNICDKSGISLTDNRKAIISQLVTLGIGTIVIPDVEITVIPETKTETPVVPEATTTSETKPEVAAVNTVQETKTTN